MNSRLWGRTTVALQPYIPGEQVFDREYSKLNTNECPYPPSPLVAAALAAQTASDLRRYPDPDSSELTAALAAAHGLRPEQVLACGGSDEALAFAFMAFFDRGDRVYFPDITYGFYRVYSDLFGLAAVELPLREDFTVGIEDYFGLDGHLFLANPNAPTGTALTPGQIEEIVRRNPDRLVVVDEAYIDFAPGMSCLELIHRYDNLLVVQTFSKSRALAGMRLGAAFGDASLIGGLNRIKYSFNPYNLDQVSQAVGIAALADGAYLAHTVERIIATRERVSARLTQLGCEVIPSSTNFLFVRHPSLSGSQLYQNLKRDGVLVRHFPKARIDNFLRVTVGTDGEMDQFITLMEGYQ